ncbi:MAG: hypothetical protein JRG86_01080 [Deltaproteobacteria bacterium]|jgi:hypothetical protein|nr:hypothetical protein [Deltaproteobacteria bacterium]MBW2498578.1 hypothetical protein [Deltaproteobacteria bacterium]
MLSGFNTNFRHRGVLFHVQTEDSGHGKPHVITHLFHGGNIIASVKQSYSDRLAEDDIEDVVRKLMEGQHKEMLKQLSRGEHDVTIGERLGPDVFQADVSGSPGKPEPRTNTEEEAPPSEPLSPPALADRSAGTDGEEAASSRISHVFGDRVVSEKPLDEVVLDYLVENARKRKRSGR